jgi:hypothetical protein
MQAGRLISSAAFPGIIRSGLPLKEKLSITIGYGAESCHKVFQSSGMSFSYFIKAHTQNARVSGVTQIPQSFRPGRRSSVHVPHIGVDLLGLNP